MDYGIEELARHICGIAILDDSEIDIDDLLYEKFDVDLEQFGKIVEALLPLALLAGRHTGSLANEVRQGFGADGVFLIKRTVEDQDLIALAGG